MSLTMRCLLKLSLTLAVFAASVEAFPPSVFAQAGEYGLRPLGEDVIFSRPKLLDGFFSLFESVWLLVFGVIGPSCL